MLQFSPPICDAVCGWKNNTLESEVALWAWIESHTVIWQHNTWKVSGNETQWKWDQSDQNECKGTLESQPLYSVSIHNIKVEIDNKSKHSVILIIEQVLLVTDLENIGALFIELML